MTAPEIDNPTDYEEAVSNNTNDLPAVIYIDQQNGAQSTHITNQSGPQTPNYVEQTIFYDPFEDRRIVLANSSNQNSPRPVRTAPAPPDTNQLRHIHSIGEPTSYAEQDVSSNRSQSTSQKLNLGSQRQQRPSDSPREFQTFRGGVTIPHSPLTLDDGFSLTPLPVSEFCEPPPTYQESIMTAPGTNAQQPESNHVITQQPTSGREVTISTQDLLQRRALSPSRKILNCQHCNTRVATVVIRQNGCATHVIAMIFLFFCLFPITILIYCLGCLKYENHYCPTCSSMIGYRVPMMGQQLVFVSPR